MDSTALLAFAGAVFIITAKPGPGMLAVVTRSLADGWKQGALLGLGICVVHIFYLVIAGMTIGIANEHIDFLSILLKALGAALMIYLGVKEFTKLNEPLVVSKNALGNKDSLNNFGTGVMICLSNPIVILFYAAFVPTLLNLSDLSIKDIALCSLALLFANWGLLVLISLMAHNVRDLLTEAAKVKQLRVFTAVMFIFIGIIFGLSAMPFLSWEHAYVEGVAQ